MLTNFVQPCSLGGVLRLAELPRVHRRRPDVADLAGLDHVVQRLHRLLDRRPGIEAVDLVEVDVVHTEPAQARIDLGHDRLARQADGVAATAHRPVHLGRQDDLVTVGEISERSADDLLARADGVDVRRVEEVDAGVEGILDETSTGVLVERPRVVAGHRIAEAHASDADAGDLEAGTAELGVLHACASAGSGVVGPRANLRHPAPTGNVCVRRVLLHRPTRRRPGTRARTPSRRGWPRRRT